MKIGAKITAISAAVAVALLLGSAAYAAHRHHRVSVEIMGHTTATLNDGTTLDVDIVRMGGHIMVMIPRDELPDYLHQQVFRVGQ